MRQRPAKPCTRVRFPSPPPNLNPSAISSAGERFPDTEEVTGSIPVSRTSSDAGQSMFLKDRGIGAADMLPTRFTTITVPITTTRPARPNTNSWSPSPCRHIASFVHASSPWMRTFTVSCGATLLSWIVTVFSGPPCGRHTPVHTELFKEGGQPTRRRVLRGRKRKTKRCAPPK